MGSKEAAEARQQPAFRQRRDDADPQPSPRAGARHALRRLGQFAERRRDRLQEGLAGIGEDDAVVEALEKRLPEMRLEFADKLAHGCRCDAKFLCGHEKAAVAAGGGKGVDGIEGKGRFHF